MSNVRSADMRDGKVVEAAPAKEPRPRSAGPSFKANKVASVVTWLGGVVATWAFINSIIAPSGNASVGSQDVTGAMIASPAVIVLALVLQAVLTVAERPFWKGDRNHISGAAIIIDALINAGGIWPYAQRLDNTSVWKMLTEALGLQGGFSQGAALVLSLFIGYILAAAPERMWRWRE